MEISEKGSQRHNSLKKPVRAGGLQKDLKELCSCPGLCLIHGVAKFRPPAKPAAQGEVTVEQVEEYRRSQGRGK